MRATSFQNLILISIVILSSSSCASFLSSFKKGFDESPQSEDVADDFPSSDEQTVGGAWSERGYMSTENEYRDEALSTPSGRARRAPASVNEDRSYQTHSLTQVAPVSSSTASKVEPARKRLYRNGSRATRDDFIDQSQEEGSLWASNGQTNYYFTKNKVRSPGDLVTLIIDAEMVKDIGSEIKRTLSQREKMNEISLLQEQNRAKYFAAWEAANKKDSIAMSASSADRTPSAVTSPDGIQPSPTPSASPSPVLTPIPTGISALSPDELEKLEKSVPRASLNDVDIFPLIELKAGETMMGEIIERYLNGNYKIRTVKRIPYKRGPARLVSIVGVAKLTDITEDTDVINSGKLYEYRVEVSH